MATESRLHQLFPTLVQTSTIENSQALNEKLLRGVEAIRKVTPNSKPDDWTCSVYTTLHSPIELLETDPFTLLKPIILQEVQRYANATGIHAPAEHLRILDAWLNVYAKGDSQELHIHQNSVFSGIYYIKAPEGCADVQFQSPMVDTMISPPVFETTELNSTAAYIPAQEGRMILFRSHLRHAVLQNETDGDRISLAFNLDIA